MMDGDTLDAQKIDPDNEDSLVNVNPSSEYGLSKSRNLFRQKDAQLTSVLSNGKWLEIVKNSPKVSSCEVSTSPSHFFSKVEESYDDDSRLRSYQSKVISLWSKTFSSPSKDYSQGTLQFNINANGSPRFVFKLENQKDIYVASLSSNVKDHSVSDYSYMIYLQKGESSSSHLVGRVKVTSLSLNERIIERQFVLFNSNGKHPQKLPCKKKNRGLSKKVVVDMIKNNQSISRLRCSWNDQSQEPRFENNFATNLETLAVVVKEEFLEEEIGGWGLKFLKKSRLVQRTDATENKTEKETSRALISMDVVIPSGIHGGPEDGPLSLIERWKSQGNCDCGGWDLGCSLTIHKGQPQKDHCNNLFDLFVEGSRHETETPSLRIANDHGGLYIVQFQTKNSVLHSFSIALSFIHSQKLQH